MNSPLPGIYSSPPLPLPEGVTEAALYAWLQSVRVEGGGEEMENYLRNDFRRFVYTYGLAAEIDAPGRRALEFGANPYFSTFLLRQFTKFEWTYSNYFGSGQADDVFTQKVGYKDFGSGEDRSADIPYHHFNSEASRFPFSDSAFDVVFYCEILEHLLNDPCKVLRDIHGILSPGGHLVLTTPNVARTENVLRLAAGLNMYDPYSGYGPYGRHNREYTCSELSRLLKYMGFEIETMFTADVHPLLFRGNLPESVLLTLLDGPRDDLGQYIFVRARKAALAGQKKPDWLYRSVDASQLAVSEDDKTSHYDAAVVPLETSPLGFGSKGTWRFSVRNGGNVPWDFPGLLFGARVYAPDGKVVREFRGTPVSFTSVGGERQVALDIDLQELNYKRLEVVFDLVYEHHFWFADVGSRPHRVVIA